MKRRTRIIVETSELVLLRRRRASAVEETWCARCGGDAPMVTPEEAAALTSASQRAIFSWVEAGLVHYAETRDGAPLVCLASLPPRAE